MSPIPDHYMHCAWLVPSCPITHLPFLLWPTGEILCMSCDPRPFILYMSCDPCPFILYMSCDLHSSVSGTCCVTRACWLSMLLQVWEARSQVERSERWWHLATGEEWFHYCECLQCPISCFFAQCLFPCCSQADLLLLSSSEPNSLVYIETAELDGWGHSPPLSLFMSQFVYHSSSETNLKVRQALPETAEMKDNEEHLAHFNGENGCTRTNHPA